MIHKQKLLYEVESGLLRMTGRMTGRTLRVYRIELEYEGFYQNDA